jgi:hypothetical protein
LHTLHALSPPDSRLPHASLALAFAPAAPAGLDNVLGSAAPTVPLPTKQVCCQRALSVTQRALSVTQRALSVTQRALSVTQRALSVTQRALACAQDIAGSREGTPTHTRHLCCRRKSDISILLRLLMQCTWWVPPVPQLTSPFLFSSATLPPRRACPVCRWAPWRRRARRTCATPPWWAQAGRSCRRRSRSTCWSRRCRGQAWLQARTRDPRRRCETPPSSGASGEERGERALVLVGRRHNLHRFVTGSAGAIPCRSDAAPRVQGGAQPLRVLSTPQHQLCDLMTGVYVPRAQARTRLDKITAVRV